MFSLLALPRFVLRVPLFLRALLRRPLTRAAYAVTRRVAWWTPTGDGPAFRYAEVEALRAATTPSAVRDVFRATHAPDELTPPWPRARDVARAAGHLSPALLHWCVQRAQGRPEAARYLLSNPALTDAERLAAQDAFEERLWRLRQQFRFALLSDYEHRARVTDSPAACDAALAWLLLRRPSDAPARPWSRFVVSMLRRQAPGHSTVALTLAETPDVPASLLRVLMDMLEDAQPTTAAALITRLSRRSPCPLSEAEARTLLIRCYEARREDDLHVFFAAMSRALQSVCWHIAFDTDPESTVLVLSRAEAGPWPGLTLRHLEPLLTAPAAAVRLAAIQMVAQVPVASSPDPTLPSGAIPSGAIPGPMPSDPAPTLLQGLTARAARRHTRHHHV